MALRGSGGYGGDDGHGQSDSPGYFAVDLAVAAHRASITFAIGAKRIAALWRTAGRDA